MRKGKTQKTTHRAKERGRVLGRSFPEAQDAPRCPTSDLQPTEEVAFVVMWNLEQHPDIPHQLPVSTLYAHVQTPRGHHTETESQLGGSCLAPWTASSVVCSAGMSPAAPAPGGTFREAWACSAGSPGAVPFGRWLPWWRTVLGLVESLPLWPAVLVSDPKSYARPSVTAFSNEQSFFATVCISSFPSLQTESLQKSGTAGRRNHVARGRGEAFTAGLCV